MKNYEVAFIRGSFDALTSKPHTPLKAAGIRTEPNISFPIPIGDIFDATAEPYPPELPPADFLGFQGLIVLPHRKLNVSYVIII